MRRFDEKNKKLKNKITIMSVIENKFNSDDHSRLIDIDLLDDPGNRYQFELVLGEGTFGQVRKKI